MIVDALIAWAVCGTVAVFLLNVNDGLRNRTESSAVDFGRFALGPITLLLGIAAIGTALGQRLRK